MKYFTDGLIKERNPFSILPGRKLKYYMAFGNHSDITLMWMEERTGGMTRCYPCLIRDGDQVLSYAQKTDPSYSEKNEALMSRWEELISPETVHTDYAVDTLKEKEFYARFREEKSARRHGTSSDEDNAVSVSGNDPDNGADSV